MSRRWIQSDERGQDSVPTHGQGLGKEVSHVPNAGNVLNAELEASNPILQPVETHVAGLRHLWLHSAVGEAHGDFVVAMDRRGRLRVTEVGEHLSFEISDLCGGKHAPILRFLNGRAHHGYARGVHGDRGVDEGGVGGTREMVKRRGHAASVGPGEERSIGEDVERHRGRPEDLQAVAMGCDKAKETVEICHGGTGGSGLGAGQRTGGGEHATVDAATVIQEIANGYLQLLLLSGGGGGGRIGGGVLRCRGAEDRGMVDGRGGGRLETIGAKAV